MKLISKVKLKIFFFALFLLISFTKTPVVKAEEVVFQDEFNSTDIGPEWQIKNFTLEDSGSYGPYYELSLSPNSSEINIFGVKTFLNEGWVDDTWVGWIGRSLVTSQSFTLENTIEIETEVVIPFANGNYAVSLFMEFDEDNRIVFNLGSATPPGNFVNVTFDENDSNSCAIPGCTSFPFSFNFNEKQVMKLAFDSNTHVIKAYVNDVLLIEDTFEGTVQNPKFGISGNVRYIDDQIDAKFDKFTVIKTINSEGLDVPSLKQYDTPWNDDEYDHATEWKPEAKNTTFERWGCAVASAAMVLQYHGYNIDPDKLNNWLKAQEDGYTKNGGVMWPAITRYIKDNSETTLKKLEFSYKNPTNQLLNDEIDSKRPPILKMKNQTTGGTHFIVAKGKSGTNDFLVNDPASATNSLLSEADDDWGDNVKVGIFTPSDTDLSYIVLFVDNNHQIKVFRPDGSPITDGYFSEDPIADAIDPNEISGNSLNAFYLPKPSSGIYKVEVTGDGNYQLYSYLYDINADASLGNFSGVSENGQINTFILNIDKESFENSITERVGFDALLEDIQKAYSEKDILKKATFLWLKSEVLLAKKQYERNHIDVAKILLKNISKQLEHLSPKFIHQEVSENLRLEIHWLIQSL